MARIRLQIPLIVCGFGRSGTRMCADVLANSSDVALQGELSIGAETLAYMAALKASFTERGKHQKYAWFRKEYETFHDIIRGGSTSSAIHKPDARYAGHKTPHHEKHFARYEALFDREEARPRYVYCLRNPFDVWRSYQVMPWSGFADIGAFIRSWTRSLEAFEAMRSAAPDRVFLFNLDAMLRAEDRQAWFDEAFLKALAIGPETFARPIADLDNTNSALAKVGTRPPPLADAHKRRLEADREVRRALETYFPWMEEGLPPVKRSLLGGFR